MRQGQKGISYMEILWVLYNIDEIRKLKGPIAKRGTKDSPYSDGCNVNINIIYGELRVFRVIEFFYYYYIRNEFSRSIVKYYIASDVIRE
jgi:hypothetical protein